MLMIICLFQALPCQNVSGTGESFLVRIMAGTEFKMPGSIDKAPRHDEATGWSGTSIGYQRGETDPPHHHIEGQLLFATRGVMLVETEGNRWVIPPQRALWLPPLQIHSYNLLSHTDL